MIFHICKLNCKALVGRYRFVLFLVFVLALTASALNAQLSVPLTIQEAIYPGAPTKGIDRNQDPVTVGIPLPDSAGINNINQLGLSGASVGQFRILGRWPDGNIKWVLVDTQASLAAGVQNTSINLTTGAGNFGGPNLATDNGSNITVNTGAAQFTIRKAKFNLFDQVVVNGKTLVDSGTSAGLVVMGPSTGTSCGTCTDAYSSSNDPNSTAIIEENGPARAVVKVDGSHVDAAGQVYMHYTVRMHFYLGKTYAKVEVILRNADETNNTAGDFNSAFKGFASYEARVTPALAGSKAFNIGTDSSAGSGTFTGNESAYLYQAYSNDGEIDDWNATNCSPGMTDRCVASYIARTPNSTGTYTYAQDGYQIVHGTSVLASGDHTKYPQGWADLSDGTGAGIEVGVYQLSGYWPKSLQFVNGGTEARVGMWPDQSLFTGGGGQPYYQAWPAYSIHDLYFNFHSGAVASPANEFLAYQHYLLARAPRTQYNNAGAFFYPLIDPVAEDNYYKSISVACCMNDLTPKIFRRYDWEAGGAGNQHDMRWSYLRNFLQRGLAGRYVFASNFYRMVVEKSFPRSDGFDWRNHPLSQLNYLGQPSGIASANAGLAIQNWIDGQHAHWYGMTDYYFMTGDETVKDQVLDGVKDDFLNANSTVNSLGMWEARDIGERLMAIARLYQTLNAINDTDATGLIPIADGILSRQVFPELNVSGYGTGSPVPGGSQGVSRTRGMQYGCCNTDSVGTMSGRVAAPFHHAILEEGLWELSQSLGPAWPNYNLTTDLAYATAQWGLTEGYGSPPGQTPTPMNSGFRFEIWLDQPNASSKYVLAPGNGQTTWFNFYMPAAYAGDLSWQQKFAWFMQRSSAAFGLSIWAEYGSHMMQAVVDKILNPPALQLINVPLTAHNNGGGSYTLSWTVPQGAVSYRMKSMAGKTIVDWVGFDPLQNTFIGDPTKTWPWFSSTDVANLPLPAAGGSTQTFNVTGLDPSQNFNFALKAYVSGGSGSGDKTPPTVSIVSPAAGSTVSGAIALTANATDDVAVAGVVFQVDGTQIGNPVTTFPYTVTVNTAQLSNGSHTFTAVATDLAGNRAQASVTVTVSNSSGGDTTPPTVTITSPLTGATVSGTITVSANATDDVAVASVAFQVDGSPIGQPLVSAPYSVSLNTTQLSNGQHTLTAVATDTAGNRAQTSVTVNVSNGSQRGVLSITSPVSGATVSGTVAIDVTATHAVSGVQLQIDGANFGGVLTSPPYSADWNTTLVSNGAHTITAMAVGGGATSTVSVTVQVLNTAGGGGGGGGSGGGGSGGGGNGGGGLGRLATAAIDANTRFVVDLQDLWSLTGCGSCSFQSSGDLITGQTTEVVLRSSSTAPVADQIVLREGTFQGTVAGAQGNQFTLQAAPGSIGSSSLNVMSGGRTQFINFSGAVQTGQNVAVRGLLFKNGMQQGPTLVASRVELLTSGPGGNPGDTAPPTVSITSPVSGATVSGIITVAANATDDVAVANIVFQLDGAQIGSPITAAPCSLSLNTVLLSNGNHTLIAVATDLAGNSAQTSVTFTVNNGGGGDTTPPTVAITFPASGATVSGTITITASATDDVAVANVVFEVDNKPIGAPVTNPPYVASLNTTQLTNGAHTLTAVATDLAGNHAQASVVVTVSNNSGGDTTPPTVTITSPAAGATVSGTITVSANATDDVAVASVTFQVDGKQIGSPLTKAPYSLSLDTTQLINGGHVLTAIATDLAGNSAQVSMSITVNNSGGGNTCPSNAWCPIYTSNPTGFGNNGWNNLLYSHDTQKFYLYASNTGGITPEGNSFWSYTPLNTSVTTNPWTKVSTCGDNTLTQTNGQPYHLVDSITATTSDKLHIALNSGDTINRNPFPSGSSVSNPKGGTIRIANEAIDYDTCTTDPSNPVPTTTPYAGFPNGNACVVGAGPDLYLWGYNFATGQQQPLRRGMRQMAGGSAPTAHVGGTGPAPNNDWTQSPAEPSNLACANPALGPSWDSAGAGSPTGTNPGNWDNPPDRHSVANEFYDSKRGRIWVSYGFEESWTMQDTWSLCIFGEPDAATSALHPWDKCASSDTYDQASTTKGWQRVPWAPGPPWGLYDAGIYENASIYDPDDDVIVEFGGMADSKASTTNVWIFCLTAGPGAAFGCTDPNDLNKWVKLTAATNFTGSKGKYTYSGNPGARDGARLAYDSVNHRILAFGGALTPNYYWNSVGIYDPKSGEWCLSYLTTPVSGLNGAHGEYNSTAAWCATLPPQTGNPPPQMVNTPTSPSCPTGPCLLRTLKFPAWTYDNNPNVNQAAFYAGPTIWDSGGVYLYNPTLNKWAHTTVQGGPTYVPDISAYQSWAYDDVRDVFVWVQGGENATSPPSLWQLPGAALGP
jgi:hypothetical protein